MPIQLTAFQADFHCIVVFMELIFHAPVTADQIVLGGKFTSNGDRIAFFAPHLSSHWRVAISQYDLNG